MRSFLFSGLLLLASALPTQAGGWKTAWRFSQAILTSVSIADAVTSRGGYELNPALGRGTYGTRQNVIKFSVLTGALVAQELVVKKHGRTPIIIFTTTNLATAEFLAGVAIRNYRAQTRSVLP